MRDKKTEADLKSMKGFLEFWGKFHSIYSDTSEKGLITKEDEEKFLETRIVAAIIQNPVVETTQIRSQN